MKLWEAFFARDSLVITHFHNASLLCRTLKRKKAGIYMNFYGRSSLLEPK